MRGAEITPLPNVMLDFSLGSIHRTVATDAGGRYSVSGLEPGKWRIQALHIGYERMALEVLVPRGGTVEVDLELTAQPIFLPPVLVRALPLTVSAPRDRASSRELGEVSLRALEGGTGMVETGLAEVVRGLPGNSDPSEPTDVLLMRGSATDLKLVLLDGAPVYTPFHLGGLLESFDPGILGGASLFLGGAPARFDGGLSYILDLQTRAPDRDRVQGEIAADLLTSRLRLEGPVPGGGGFLLGSRMIHDLGTSVLGREDSPYGYLDLLLRGEWGDPDGTRGFLTGFWNREEVNLDLGELAFSDGAQWGNQSASGGLSGTLGGFAADVRGAFSRYDARLPVADSLPLFAWSRSDRGRLTADLSRKMGKGSFRVGASVDALGSDYLARGLDSLGRLVESDLRVEGRTGGGYAEGAAPLGRGLSFRAGLRLDHFSGGEGWKVAPRGSLTWLLTDNAALTLAAGRYHQFAALSSPEVAESLAPGGDSGTPGRSARLAVGSANHLVVSLDQILAPGLRLGLEGFVKNFSGVSNLGDERLNASGVDLRVAREGDRAAGWVGYTLTWFWASDEGFLGGDSRFSGRHLLSAGLSARLSERTGIRLRLGFGDGLPYTSIPIARDGASDPTGAAEGTQGKDFTLNQDNVLNEAPGLAIGPDEGFLRLDAEIFGTWTAVVGGHLTQLRPYLRLLNALNRRDALFYHFDPWRDPSPRPLAELPILPLVGVEWVF
jgi:hypothetical protein